MVIVLIPITNVMAKKIVRMGLMNLLPIVAQLVRLHELASHFQASFFIMDLLISYFAFFYCSWNGD